MKEKQVIAYDKVLTMTIAGLRFCGIWSLKSSASTYLKFFHVSSRILVTTLLLINIVAFSVDFFNNSNDLMIATDSGLYIAGTIMVLSKIYNFYIHQTQIYKLTEAIYTPVRNLRRSTNAEVLAVLETNTFYETLGFSLLCSLYIILVMAMIFLVPKNGGELIMRAVYPVDTTVSPNFQLALAEQMYALSYGITAVLLLDGLGLGFIRWVNVQLIILTYNYQNCAQRSFQNDPNHSNMSAYTDELIKNPQDPTNVMNIDEDPIMISTIAPFLENESENMKDDFISRFRRCVLHHQRLIDSVDDINTIYGANMLMQLLTSFFMICLTTFQAALGADEKLNMWKFVITLGAAFTQLLFWCWFGNELYYQKHSLLKAQWMSGWENQLNSTSKNLIIMSMAQTMRPLEMKAGPFAIMSMETFISVVRSSYSIYAVLRTISVGKN